MTEHTDMGQSVVSRVPQLRDDVVLELRLRPSTEEWAEELLEDFDCAITNAASFLREVEECLAGGEIDPMEFDLTLFDPIVLCGTMFPGLRVIRHRLFESNVPLVAPMHPGRHPLVFTHDERKAHYGKLDQNLSFVQVTGGGNASVANKLDAMGIDWMTGAEVNEAIPPAYTEYVGGFLRAAVTLRETAAA